MNEDFLKQLHQADQLAQIIPGVRNPRYALNELAPYEASLPKGKMIMSANESPFNLPEIMREQLARDVLNFDFNRYPDPLSKSLREKISAWHQVACNSVLVGNGADELIYDIMLAWAGVDSAAAGAAAGGKRRTILQFPPNFSMYGIYAQALDTRVLSLQRDPEVLSIDIDLAVDVLQGNAIDIVFVDNPGNPTGQITKESDIVRLLEASDALIVVDEAYLEFSDAESMSKYLGQFPNLVILRTLSKAYSLAGLRVGYLLASPEIVDFLTRVRMPYSVNSFSQHAASIVLDAILNPDTAAGTELQSQISSIKDEREWLTQVLADMPGVRVWKSQANFVLFKLDKAQSVWHRMLETHDIYLRNLSTTPGLTDCLRVTVGTSKENIAFKTALRESIAYLSLPDNFFGG